MGSAISVFKKQSGFSLVELSILITIAATLAVGYVTWNLPPTITNASKAATTNSRMQEIATAIETFRVNNARLPCPATRTSTSTTLGYDDEAMTITVANGAFCTTAYGAVPTRALGLPADYMFDGWGRKFIFHVAPNLCGPSGTGCTSRVYTNPSNVGNLTVVVKTTAGTTSDKETEAAGVLVSHGIDGLGAYLPSGSQVTTTGSTADETENNDVDTSYVTRPIDSTYDDIVLYKTKNQLDAVASDPVVRLIDQATCNNNSNAINTITRTAATSMATNITALQLTDSTGTYNTGDQAVIEMMWMLQSVCADSSYYSTAKQCPAGGTYDATTDTCSCANGTWTAGGC